ncbi:L-serine ammonia-lyase, iron-sulfur-dependent, subunit alpha [Acetivibrio ethanolgignens]|uniref:L-serine dehydratase n=1 Tax=Acetivibrio ethanolgignens TaxID=290052 RepID=A0A0V8QCS4_9FIRM|nr:L-serine ammonia-lyase, iron-sulfur-dependent, subunit alpha [Acetivibrio ethanolgignens]KSV58327.1 serine dehydratase [Acetivibrio ethanolgignens]
MYNSIEDMLRLAKEENKPLYQIILDNEVRLSESNEAEVLERLNRRYQVMEEAATKALTAERKTVGSLITGITKPQYEYAKKGDTLCGDFLNIVMARALSCSEVNASMGKICAAPTAGACGILPAVLISLEEKEEFPRKKVLEGLLIASGIGAVIMKNATVAGAEGGCQAECGVAAAMAAAAAVYLKGGTDEMIADSVAISLMNCMGLVCDPVAGLVQVPCAQRNASQAVNALLSADLILAGMKSIIPPDEVVDAMYRVGKLLPYQLKETALGGIAKTKTGQAIAAEIFGKE